MHAAWVGFATNGDCGWPKYDLSRRATMRFDMTSKIVNDPRCAERALRDGVRLQPVGCEIRRATRSSHLRTVD